MWVSYRSAHFQISSRMFFSDSDAVLSNADSATLIQHCQECNQPDFLGVQLLTKVRTKKKVLAYKIWGI